MRFNKRRALVKQLMPATIHITLEPRKHVDLGYSNPSRAVYNALRERGAALYGGGPRGLLLRQLCVGRAMCIGTADHVADIHGVRYTYTVPQAWYQHALTVQALSPTEIILHKE